MNYSLISDTWNSGYFTAGELREKGEYYRARKAVEEGNLLKIRHGVYGSPDSLISNMVDIEKIIPGGVVCMYSAWNYYGLTTTVPPAICVAVKASRKVVLPHIIPFEIYYWKESFLNLGVVEREVSNHIVLMTDIEKSVCDALRYRNKIGMEVCVEILTNYLNRNSRNLTLLMEYAKMLRVGKVLSNYLDLYLQIPFTS